MNTRILLIGLSGDNAIRHILTQANEMRLNLVYLDLEHFYSRGSIWLQSWGDKTVRISLDEQTIFLNDFSGIYQRIIAPLATRLTPGEFVKQYGKYVALQNALYISQTRVINTPGTGWENSAKLFQAALLANAGFNVPVSLSTSITEDAILFSQDQETIYKSNSSYRSIVERTSSKKQEDFRKLHVCPVLFQSCINGDDVRIHTVDDKAFGVKIYSDVIDYRYARKKGGTTHYVPFMEIPPNITEMCIKYARSRNIILAGFDFKTDTEGRWYCLEMNPMPSYEGYDRVLDYQITHSIFQYLSRDVEASV